MNWKNVRLIFQREVRDQIRDRRTLFMVVILPLLLYPGLAIGMVEVQLWSNEQPRTVVVLGAANLPEKPPLLEKGGFAAEWFTVPSDVNRLQVVADTGSPPPDDKAAAKRDAELLHDARELQPLVEQLGSLQQAAREAGQSAEGDQLFEQVRSAKDKVAERFSTTKIQVLIIVSAGLTQRIEQTNQMLAAKGTQSADAASSKSSPGFLVVENSADEKSGFGYQRVKQILNAWEQRILQDRLRQAKLPPTLATPVNPITIDVAAVKQFSANIWSKILPTLLIIMAVTGAFYPAVDVAAGEKERGTMETLLICPAQRSEIVVGKFLTVLVFSVANVLLNLASMGFTGKYAVAALGTEALSKTGSGVLSFPGAWEMLWLAILMVPLAAFYSAISLALATFARSTREGQYYLTPLLFVTLGLTLFCMSPAAEIDPFYSILPVVGPALLLKEVLAMPGSTAPLVYVLPVLMTSIAYSGVGLWWAISMFNREDVLFREAERFDVRLWIRHLLRDKESTPSSVEAVICIVLIMLLQFGVLELRHGTGPLSGIEMLRLLIIQQIVFIGCPALFMGIMLTTSVVRTFRLRLPSWNYLLMACIMPLALHPLSFSLGMWLQKWFFPPLPEQIAQIARVMGNPEIPWWLVILAIAVAPAICEELAFRGFILSGFVRSSRPGVAIVLSSLAFGIVHMVPQQVFNAMLLGMLLALFALRSGSLLPGIVFHLMFNSLEIVRERVSALGLKGPVVDWFITTTTSKDNEHLLQYNWLTLAIAFVVAVLLISKLVKSAPGSKQPTDDDLPNRARGESTAPPARPPVATR